jgi:hypothetical protein
MENKKLLKILLKDMGELEESIAEIKASKRFDTLEMEFIHTRAKGILQLVQLLDTKDETVQTEIKKMPEVLEKPPEEADADESFKEITEDQQPVEKETTEQPEKAELREEKPGQKEPAPKSVMTGAPGTTVQEKPSPPVKKDKQENEDEVVLEEGNAIADTVSRLGDSFLKGKSLNDLITDQNKLEFKLSNRPVNSIQAAIGINDRFQYIRELFDGDNQKFLETVKILDSKQNIKEAVDYLRNNFKWKKNETSLKFVNLVKRRFINE